MGRNRALMGTLAVLVLLVAAWLVLKPGPHRDAPVPSPPVGQPAPALAGRTLTGSRLDLAELRGHVVLVNVWAAWCAPCRAELPVLVAARTRLAPQGLRLVGIDIRDGERQARELLAQTGGDPATSLVDPQGRLAARWQVREVPMTFVVGADGRVLARRLGAVTPAWIDDHVTPLLDRPAGG